MRKRQPQGADIPLIGRRLAVPEARAMRVEFTVHGTPQPQGSAKAFIPKGWKRAIITSDNRSLKPWRQDVSAMASEAMQLAGVGGYPIDEAVRDHVRIFVRQTKIDTAPHHAEDH